VSFNRPADKITPLPFELLVILIGVGFGPGH
jgi:hypothetical protein